MENDLKDRLPAQVTAVAGHTKNEHSQSKHETGDAQIVDGDDFGLKSAE
jgi:hypothetical protein